jgi:hypothetical protein
MDRARSIWFYVGENCERNNGQILNFDIAACTIALLTSELVCFDFCASARLRK